MKEIVMYIIIGIIFLVGIGISFVLYKKNLGKEKILQYRDSFIALFITLFVTSYIKHSFKVIILTPKKVIDFFLILFILITLVFKIGTKKIEIKNKYIDIFGNYILPITVIILYLCSLLINKV